MTCTKIQQGIHDYMIAGLTPMHLASVERGERLFMTKTKQVIKDWLRDRISVTMRGRVPSESHRKAISRALLKYNAEKRKT
jgi:hypothetical protein